MIGDEDEYETDELGTIPGDNDKPSDESQPGFPGAPINLTHIPAQGGEIPIELEKK